MAPFRQSARWCVETCSPTPAFDKLLLYDPVWKRIRGIVAGYRQSDPAAKISQNPNKQIFFFFFFFKCSSKTVWWKSWPDLLLCSRFYGIRWSIVALSGQRNSRVVINHTAADTAWSVYVYLWRTGDGSFTLWIISAVVNAMATAE